MIGDLTGLIESVICSFYTNGGEGAAFNELPNLFEGLSYLLEKLSFDLHFSEELNYMNSIVQTLQRAMECVDTVKICDLLYFELTPQLQLIGEKLQ